MAATAQPLTGGGTILGTLHYMSPEQVEGREADPRSDIFSFGCVLYEMVTGTRAFDGSSAASVMAAILERQPPRAAMANPVVPAALDHVIAKSLAKSPDDRWQTARDIATELQWLLNEPRSEAAAASRPRRDIRWVAAAAVMALVILGGAFWLGSRPHESSALVTRLPLRFSPADIRGSAEVGGRLIAISPDGRRIAFVGRRTGQESPGDGRTDTGTQLYIHALDQSRPVALAGTANASGPFFSPDRNWVGFTQSLALKKVPVTGGVPQVICDSGPGGHRGAVWAPDNTIIFVPGDAGAGLMRVSADGGTPVVLAKPDPKREIGLRWPHLLPDGDTLLFTVTGQNDGTGLDARTIEALSLKSGERRGPVQAGTNPHYLPTGHLLFAGASKLWAVPFDPGTGSVRGSAVAVVEPVAIAPTGAAQFDVAGNGTVVYLEQEGGPASAGYPIVWVTPGELPQPLKLEDRRYGDVRISPEGSLVLFDTRDGNTDVWLHDVTRGSTTRLTFDGGEEETPVWSPDGKQIAFSASRLGERRTVYLKNVDGTGSERAVWTSDVHSHLYAWSPDGRTLVATTIGTSNSDDIWLVPVAGGTPVPFANSRFSESQPNLSPDGQWLAYQSNETGRVEIYVQPFPTGGPKHQVSIDGGLQPVWSRDGRRIVFRNAGKFYAADVSVSTGQLQSSAARHVADDPSPVAGHINYDVAADGRLLVIAVPRNQTLLPTIVFNAFADISRRFRAP